MNKPAAKPAGQIFGQFLQSITEAAGFFEFSITFALKGIF